MRLPNALKEFVVRPVMIIVGTRDRANRPAVGRGVGARIVGEEAIEIILSRWQWPDTVENIQANGQAAFTFANPQDYVSYQLKGPTSLRPAEPSDHRLASRYSSEILARFVALGLQPDFVTPWLAQRDLTVARLAVREIYLQTPGPRAGTSVRQES